MELSQIFGWIATILFSVCYIPQIIKTHQKQTVDGLSFWLLVISLAANVVALFYAAMIGQFPLQVKYVLGMLFVSVCIALYIKVYFKKNTDVSES